MNNNIKELRFFGLVLSLAISFWSIIYYIFGNSHWSDLWPAYVVIISLISIAFTYPIYLSGVHEVWIKLAELINKIISHSMMTIIFVFIITPTALIRRLTGNNALKDRKTLPESYRIASKPLKKDDMEHPY